MRTLSSRLFHEASHDLGEGVFWFEDRLWWVDITAGRLHSVDTAGHRHESFFLGSSLGAAAPVGGSHFLVALEKEIALWNRRTQSLKILASPEQHLPDSRFNDAKCDPAGRFLAGTLSKTGKPRASALYSLGPDGTTRHLLRVGLSNGLAWTADGSTLYYIDSHSREIAAFPYDLGTGSIGERRVIVRVPDEMGIPDGMTIDSSGNLWVAHWGGWAVRCWSPVSGACLAEIPLPCAQPTSCCFGGPDLDHLYITSARAELAPHELSAQPLAGSLFVCRPGRRGLPLLSGSLDFLALS